MTLIDRDAVLGALHQLAEGYWELHIDARSKGRSGLGDFYGGRASAVRSAADVIAALPTVETRDA